MLLPASEIVKLADVAVDAGLGDLNTRQVLLSGVNRKFVASQILPPSLAAKPQLISDLQTLNSHPRLADGTVPLRDWLQMAEALTSSLEQNATFKSAHDRVAGRMSGQHHLPPVEALPEIKEKIIYQDDTVPVGFLADGVVASRSVAKLEIPRYENGQAVEISPGKPYLFLGTGWVLAKRLLITNHHVVAAREDGQPPPAEPDLRRQAEGAWVRFGYDEEEASGVAMRIERLEAWDVGLDYAILRTTEALPGPPLERRAERLEGGKYHYIPVNIVQHPGGKAKKVAIRNNLVTASDDTDLRYFTDTRGGSSGSPVFDDTWKVVALHRGSTAATKEVSFQGRSSAWVNFGTHLPKILEHLQGANPTVWNEVAAP